MKLFKKAICMLAVAVVIVSVSVLPVAAVSSVPYKGYSYDSKGYDIDAPVGYVPDRTYFSTDMGMKDKFYNVYDMQIFEDEIYIADSHAESTDADDTTHDRIVVLDKDYQYVRQYTQFVDKKTGEKYEIKNPRGVFVTEDEIFVCCDVQTTQINDNGESEVFYDGYVLIGDHKGNLTRMITNPAEYSPVVESNNFRPFSIVEDKSGYLYVRAQDEHNGLMVFSEEGQFLQYFGANKVSLTFELVVQQMWKKIFSREAADTMQKTVPTEMSGIFVDDEGFLYTTTGSMTIDENLRLRKLNAAGDNILGYDPNATLEKSYGDRFVSWHQDVWNTSFVDCVVDENDVIAVLDQKYGRVFLYDQQSVLLSVFGYLEVNPLVKNGSTTIPVAIEKLGDDYLVLDRGQKAIVTYRPTDFIEKLLTANQYYMKGWYIEGEPYWQEVLKYDSNNVRAYAAIGKSLLEQGKYEESLEYLKKGYDRTSYSLAYSEFRREYIRANYWWLIPSIVVGVFLIIKLFKLIRKLLGFKDEKTDITFR